jgi:hypothetical protein
VNVSQHYFAESRSTKFIRGISIFDTASSNPISVFNLWKDPPGDDSWYRLMREMRMNEMD